MSEELKAGNLGTMQQTAWHALELHRVLDDLQVREIGRTPGGNRALAALRSQ